MCLWITCWSKVGKGNTLPIEEREVSVWETALLFWKGQRDDKWTDWKLEKFLTNQGCSLMGCLPGLFFGDLRPYRPWKWLLQIASELIEFFFQSFFKLPPERVLKKTWYAWTLEGLSSNMASDPKPKLKQMRHRNKRKWPKCLQEAIWLIFA